MRDHYLDTTKAVLIFLVVFGHFLERMIGWGNPIDHVLLGTIYFVHMPAFIFISGLFYKDNKWFKNIIFFIALYIPFQLLFPLFDALWSGKFQLNWHIFDRPYWVLWYLQGMIVWTVLAHFLMKLKHFAVPISIILCLLVGLSPWNNYQYSVGRIFTFFPFFMIGVMYGKTLIHKIQQFHKVWILGFIILLMIASLVYFAQVKSSWLYGSYSYAQLKVSAVDGTLIRSFYMLISILGVFAIFALSKTLGSRWVKLGKNTLPVYLLHGFVVILIARYLKLSLNIYAEIGICMVLSILTCWLLQQSFFDNLLRKMSLWLTKPTEKLDIK